MKFRSVALASFLSAVGLAALACGDTASNSEFDAGTLDAGGGTSGSSGASGTSGSSGGFGSSGSSGDSGKGDGGAEVCDGIDNDGNGIIDDVDVGGDGICDCLRIGTLGVKGTAGEGDVFAAWLNGKSTAGATDLSNQVITPALLAEFQVIVAQNVSTIGRSYSPAEIAALGDWVKGGGGFLTLIGYADTNERTNVNSLLGTFGMSYLATPVLAKSGGSTIPVSTWTAGHPVTDGITKIGVDNGYEVGGTGTTLASEQSIVMLKAQEVALGHVLVWGDEWITFNTEWKDHPDYQVERFWLQMIKWLTPAKECQVPIPPAVK